MPWITLPTIKRKSLDAADSGDFINSVFNIAVESVDALLWST